MGAGNPVKFWSYVFIPKNLDPNRKYPLLILPHGGVHANFTTYYTHIIRELMAQQYVVAAPEYRGSTGYGKPFYEKIDYGGLIALFAVFDHPESYAVAFAGVPVSDLIARMGYYDEEDVNVLEVEHLIQALKAEGKRFEYEIFQQVAGGHSFDRMDTKTAREIRRRRTGKIRGKNPGFSAMDTSDFCERTPRPRGF
jgi:hypothetical protein